MLTEYLAGVETGRTIGGYHVSLLGRPSGKELLKTGNFEGKCEQDFFGNVRSPFRLVNNKVIVPTDEEVGAESPFRSAKLRIAEKV